MPSFYTAINKRYFFNAPQYNISRHTYRGPRSSEKINLEINQFNYSVRKLYETQNEFFSDFRMYTNLLLDGGDTEVDNADGDLILEGIDNLAARVEGLKKRVEALEA